MIPIKETPAGVTFAVKINPRARQNAITGTIGEALKLSLTAPPIDGKANAACIDFLAKVLRVSRASVTIASGESSHRKVIRVSGSTAKEVGARLSGEGKLKCE